MALRIVWSPEAVEDLESIAEYISRDSECYVLVPDTIGVPAAVSPSETDVGYVIRRLSELRQRGILSEDEFQRKKAGLLSSL